MMTINLYDFGEVESKKETPRTINEKIKRLMRGDHLSEDDKSKGGKQKGAYSEMEAYLKAPGVTGSTQFDHAYAVSILLKHDKKDDGYLQGMLDDTLLTHMDIWYRIQVVMRQVGFDMKNGRLVGVAIEDESRSGKIEGNAEAA